MILINVILVIIVAECMRLFVSGSESHSIESARYNYSFEEDMYGPMFSSDGYPKPGDIPMLNRKIFRGTRVSILEHPYVVSIRRNYAHYLTGTLLNRNLVVTVAHPIVGVPLTELNVVVGENYADRGSQALTVVIAIIHEQFNPYTLAADIALLRIFESIQYRSAVKPIAALFEYAHSYVNKMAFVTGWGRCDMNVKPFTNCDAAGCVFVIQCGVAILSNQSVSIATPHGMTKMHPAASQCVVRGRELCLPRSSIYYHDEKFDPMLRSINFEIQEFSLQTFCEGYQRHETRIRRGMLCMGIAREENPVSPCLAVPGAPLVVSGKLLGIQSWGFGCGYHHDLPLIYTNVQYYYRWIINNIYVLRKIKKYNMTTLFEATKAQKLYGWLRLTRKYVVPPHEHREDDLQPIELDRMLAKLKGSILDLRDYVNNKKFHKSKRDMYRLIRILNNRTKKMKQIKKYIKHNKSQPFIISTINDDVQTYSTEASVNTDQDNVIYLSDDAGEESHSDKRYDHHDDDDTEFESDVY